MNKYFDIGERPIDPPDGHDIMVRATDVLDADGGVDVYDLHNSASSQRIILDLVAALIRAKASGNLKSTSSLIYDSLEELRYSEICAIAEELEAVL